MFAIKPLLWYNPDTVDPESANKLIDEYTRHGVFVIAAYGDSNHPPFGTIMPERYPTPEELFRWSPK